jgi:hypothetical protein
MCAWKLPDQAIGAEREIPGYIQQLRGPFLAADAHIVGRIWLR